MTAVADVTPRKGERTRARLLELAVQRFAAEGYRRTSLADVARDAGLTPAAVYAYFSGKEGLFEAAVDFDAAAFIDEARAAVPDGTSMRDRLYVLTAAFVDGLQAHPLARRVLAGHEPDVIDRLLDLPSLEALSADTAELLAAAQERGEVRGDLDPVLVAEGLQTIVLALLVGHLQSGIEPDSHQAIAAMAVLDAALAPPATRPEPAR